MHITHSVDIDRFKTAFTTSTLFFVFMVYLSSIWIWSCSKLLLYAFLYVAIGNIHCISEVLMRQLKPVESFELRLLSAWISQQQKR